VLHLPSNLTLEAASSAGAAATYTATADDVVSGNLPVTFSIPSGSMFPLGTTTVTVTATDGAGNPATGTFTVTVRDSTAPIVNCPANIVAVAAPGATSAVVNFTVTGSDGVSNVTITTSVPSGAAFALGMTTVTATAKDAAGNTSLPCTFTVTVRVPTTTAVLPIAVQYSDTATLQATVSAAPVAGQPLAGTVQFFVNGNPVGTAPVVNGVATLPLPVNSAAGSYNLTAQFTSTNYYYLNSVGGPATLTVNKENSKTIYTGDTALLTGGPDFTTANVRLGAHLTPESDGAGFAGDISKATVVFELFKSGNQTSTPDQIVGGVVVDANGDALATAGALAAGSYTVKVRVEGTNQYWTANPVGTGALGVVVATKDTQSKGDGWVADATSGTGRATFDFDVKADKKLKDGPVKGNLTLSFRGTDGFDYVVESTGWQGGFLQFAAEPGVTPLAYTRANFKGGCVVRKVNPTTHQTVATLSNYTFEVFAKDGDNDNEGNGNNNDNNGNNNDNNGSNTQQPDAYAFTVWNAVGQVWHQTGSRSSLVTLGGGDINNKVR
jgi:hypothetical protein